MIITNFRTDRYLNNFEEQLFGILRLRKYQTLCENEAIKHDLVEFKVQCLKVFCYHGNKSTILLFYSIFKTTLEVSSKLYFVEICQVSEKLWLFNHKGADFWLLTLDLKDHFLASLTSFLVRACFHSKTLNRKFGADRLIFVATGKEKPGGEWIPPPRFNGVNQTHTEATPCMALYFKGKCTRFSLLSPTTSIC